MTRTHPRGREAVLLDLDGTLIASRDSIVSSLHLTMRELGQPLDPAAGLDWVIGPPLHDIMARLLGTADAGRLEAAVAAYRRHYNAGPMLQSPLFDGIEAFLHGLRRSGRRVFLATSKPLHMARRIIEAHGLSGHFEALHGAQPDDSGAEKPELIAALLHDERVDPARAVMIGDRRYDISGAHANGMRAIGVLWGYGGRAELEAAGADALAETPCTLPGLIDEQLGRLRDHAA